MTAGGLPTRRLCVQVALVASMGLATKFSQTGPYGVTRDPRNSATQAANVFAFGLGDSQGAAATPALRSRNTGRFRAGGPGHDRTGARRSKRSVVALARSDNELSLRPCTCERCQRARIPSFRGRRFRFGRHSGMSNPHLGRATPHHRNGGREAWRDHCRATHGFQRRFQMPRKVPGS